YPGLTRLFYLIQCFVYQQYVTRQASRRQHVLLKVEQYVFVFVRREVGQLGTEGKLILQTHNGIIAIGLRSSLTNNTAYAAATVTNDVVPHHFQTVLR